MQSVLMTCHTLEQEKGAGRPSDEICEERGWREREKGLKGRESRKTGKFRAVENNTNIQLAKFSLKANIEK